jgi:hypothetical protein
MHTLDRLALALALHVRYPMEPWASRMVSGKDCHPTPPPFHAPSRTKMAGKPYLARGLEKGFG